MFHKNVLFSVKYSIYNNNNNRFIKTYQSSKPHLNKHYNMSNKLKTLKNLNIFESKMIRDFVINIICTHCFK